MGFCKPTLFSAICVCLVGCSSVPKPDVQFLAKPFSVRLVQVSLADREAVRGVIAKNLPKDAPETQEKISEAIDAAQSQAAVNMASAFAAFPNMRVNSEPLTLRAALAGFPILKRDQPLAPDMLNELRDAAGTDALLRYGISDYGSTPKAWRSGVITFEVVSTLGIAAIAYAKPATRAIAGAYLVQEAVEETIEAYSGFWALDEVYRPVRIEAEMIDLQTGHRAWADGETGFSDRRLSRIFTTVTDDERKAQLQTALREAVDKIAHNFEQSLR